MLIPLFKKVINFFDSFPEIGPRQALRLFFWLIRQKEETKKNFLANLETLLEKTHFCHNCFFPTVEEFCPICSDPKRQDDIIAVVARETDVLSLETAKIFKGKYFILGGLVLPFEDKTLIKERIKVLEERLEQNNRFKEVIIALPYTREAEPTLKYLNILRKKFPDIKFTFLARGIPTGGEVEFADPETLRSAFLGRITD
ncbi:MAG: toprim domain-containing protein [Patescibacteria group bacterium]|nr:toprim domain-containing protein [Patescibacteria group bacterium]